MKTVTQKKQVLAGKPISRDLFAAACVIFMIGLFLFEWIFYRVEMLFCLIPLLVIGTYIVLFCLIPESYEFDASSLNITHRFKKTKTVLYTSVFNYSSQTHDNFLNITSDNNVKVYYEDNGKKRVFSCVPKDVDTFVSLLKENCPVFYTDPIEAKINCFFGDTKSE